MAESISVQLKKGVLELCVLAGGIDMGEGTIYPLMRRLQDEGLVATYLAESPSGPPRKYYRLTDTGRQSLQAQKTEWSAFARAVNAILGDAG